MDLRVQTTLLAGLIAIAIGATVLLRPRPNRLQWGFGGFCLSVAAWYLSTSLAAGLGNTLSWRRANLVCAILLPITAAGFLRMFVEGARRAASQLWRAVMVVGAVLVCSVFLAPRPDLSVAPLIFAYLFTVLGTSLLLLWM